MDEARYRLLVRVAIILTVAWIGWMFYDTDLQETKPGAHELAAADRYLEDGQFGNAVDLFSKVYAEDENNIGALRGMAQSHMRLGLQQRVEALQLEQQNNEEKAGAVRAESARHLQTARALYDNSIKRERAIGISDANRRALGVAYANRGILRDQLADYTGALNDYLEAVKLAPEVKQGPGFLTRFMRNQPEKPPSVADRARYLEEQLAKPPAERLMRQPDKDAKQQSYRLE
ncbi:MAG: hypothetical protein OQK68_10320 [Sedimenticola sp.]|nr:hypothetical protein [Sedimenticola sp.]